MLVNTKVTADKVSCFSYNDAAGRQSSHLGGKRRRGKARHGQPASVSRRVLGRAPLPLRDLDVSTCREDFDCRATPFEPRSSINDGGAACVSPGR